MKLPSFAEYRKGLTAVGGALVAIVGLGVLHGTAQHWAVAVVSVLTAAGVIAVPNGTKSG